MVNNKLVCFAIAAIIQSLNLSRIVAQETGESVGSLDNSPEGRGPSAEGRSRGRGWPCLRYNGAHSIAQPQRFGFKRRRSTGNRCLCGVRVYVTLVGLILPQGTHACDFLKTQLSCFLPPWLSECGLFRGAFRKSNASISIRGC